jgi:hypothetical protein
MRCSPTVTGCWKISGDNVGFDVRIMAATIA